MTREVEFPRNIDRLLASADDKQLLVIAGWTVAISKDASVMYAKTYNTSPAQGFYEHDGSVVLSHGGGKLSLTRQEAEAVLQLIRTAYGPI